MIFETYTIDKDKTILDALKRIENNNKGFLIVVDQNYLVLGTLTDGDIRRAFINGHNVTDDLNSIFSAEFLCLYESDTLETVISMFKSPKIDFLPIVNVKGILINIITKKQLHAALIGDMDPFMNTDFDKLEQLIIEHEIYNKPWGFYKTTFLNPYARAKIIRVNPNEELSLQEHKMREEHWVVVAGNGELTLGESQKELGPGDYVFIPKGCKHRVKNVDSKKTLMISEVQLGEYFGEDDIVRYTDKYGRAEL